MRNRLISVVLIIATILFVWLVSRSVKPNFNQIKSPVREERIWQIKSIDTMKYSRDLSAEKLSDPTFDQTIDSQMKEIKAAGANYVGIATPYDEKFVPILSRWVKAARRNNLHVWFRGNFSSWEGWFGQPRSLSREEHLGKTTEFIKNHEDLFKDGDAFSPCPECENGGPGDPRYQTSVESFRSFMISEKQASDAEFKKIHKNVITNLASMNYDVAKLVMDEATTKSMGNLIVIDHYVKTPQLLADSVQQLSDSTGAQIFLGEIGAPIEDITGSLNQQEQASWIDDALRLLSKNKSVIGVNYWVNVGGLTALFNEDVSPKPAAEVVKKYFSLTELD